MAEWRHAKHMVSAVQYAALTLPFLSLSSNHGPCVDRTNPNMASKVIALESRRHLRIHIRALRFEIPASALTDLGR